VAANLKPLGDRIVVTPSTESEARSPGGIFIPDTAKEKPQTGKVVAAGPGRVTDDGKRIAMSVKAGDTVLFAKFSGAEFKQGGVDYLILRESDVLAVVV
jgi:chaperonin GroES